MLRNRRVKTRWWILAGLLALTIIVALILNGSLAGIISNANTSNPSASYGVAMANTLPFLSETQLNAELDDLESLKVGWIRIDMAWDDVQPDNSETFDWSNMDRIVAAATAHHIEVLPTLAYTPAWARPDGCTSDKCAPVDPAQFANFAAAAAARYAPLGVHDWEIWNEPNITEFWLPEPSPTNYAALLKAAYTAIKSQDPTAVVISGGLAPSATSGGEISPTDFLTELYQAGAKPYFDAVGDHPYSYPLLPSQYRVGNAWSEMASTTPSLRSIMEVNGDGDKQIWITEFGAPTGGPDGVSETIQAHMLNSAGSLLSEYSWAGPFFWYSYQDLGTSQSTDQDFYGLLRYDGSQKPAYNVFKNLLSQNLHT